MREKQAWNASPSRPSRRKPPRPNSGEPEKNPGKERPSPKSGSPKLRFYWGGAGGFVRRNIMRRRRQKNTLLPKMIGSGRLNQRHPSADFGPVWRLQKHRRQTAAHSSGTGQTSAGSQTARPAEKGSKEAGRQASSGGTQSRNAQRNGPPRPVRPAAGQSGRRRSRSGRRGGWGRHGHRDIRQRLRQSAGDASPPGQ